MIMITSVPVRLQSNLNNSNTDGSFTMDNSNSYLSLDCSRNNMYRNVSGIFSYFILTMYVVCTH